jgi:hypothetical protein
MLLKVPLCLLAAAEPPAPLLLGPPSGVSLPRGDEPSLLLVGEYSMLSMLRDRDQRLARGALSDSVRAFAAELAVVALTSRKMWTVSVVDETHSRVELRLNAML